jgi:hypothetical protein
MPNEKRKYKGMICKVALIGFLFLLNFISLSCHAKFTKSEVHGELTIYYTLNDFDHPIVIWLEDDQMNYVRTLLVSDWLSNDGHRYPNICPDWNSVALWSRESKSVIDAVTSATPSKDKHFLKLDCSGKNCPPGIYHYLIEMHVKDKYNILFTGEIEIGDKYHSSNAKITYIPEAHPDPSKRNILGSVSAKYIIID